MICYTSVPICMSYPNTYDRSYHNERGNEARVSGFISPKGDKTATEPSTKAYPAYLQSVACGSNTQETRKPGDRLHRVHNRLLVAG